ncbi:hypothetical protein GCM10022215_17860 [Nocardioides fonticola]|uniref:Endonuclease/exonuclease/phosphatase domain-containing protein n=1 Tax=Nocardioides fonticola TaxID=450363 RepID=A0ABP7XIT6_9ACTN
MTTRVVRWVAALVVAAGIVTVPPATPAAGAPAAASAVSPGQRDASRLAMGDASRSAARDGFDAVTWNVLYTTPARRLAPILKGFRARGVTLALMNEAGGADLTRMIRAQGWRSCAPRGQWRVAWDPTRWARDSRCRAIRLSPSTYYSMTSRRWTTTYAATIRLRDRESGLKLRTYSYHLPTHVQRPPILANRVRVSAEAMRRLHELAEHHPHADAVLAGGDDNLDERFGGRARWPLYVSQPGGLRLVQPPAGTLGRHGRRVDDFRTISLDPGRGWTAPSGGDHQAHGRAFRWHP